YRLITLRKIPYRPPTKRDNTHLYLEWLGSTTGVHRKIIVPISPMITPPNKNDPLPIIRDLQTRDLLRVVHRKGGELPRRKIRPFGHIDIPAALFIHRPGDARSGSGGRELRGKRIFFERKKPGDDLAGRRLCQPNQRRQQKQ